MTKNKLLLVSLKEDEAKHIAQVISNETCRKILDLLAESEATETEIAQKLNLPLSTTHYNLQQLMKSNLVVAEEFHYSQRGKEVNHYKLANQYIIIAPKNTSMHGLKEKLRSILPVAFITLVGTGIIHVYSKLFLNTASGISEVLPNVALYAQKETADAVSTVTAVAENAAQPLAAVAADQASGAVAKTAGIAAEQVSGAVQSSLSEIASRTAPDIAQNVSTAVQTIAERTVDNTTSAISNVQTSVSNNIPHISEPNYALWFLIGGLTVMVFMVLIEIIRAIKNKGEAQ